MTFEHDCTLWVKNAHLSHLDATIGSKDHRKRTTETKVDQEIFLFRKIFSSKPVVS